MKEEILGEKYVTRSSTGTAMDFTSILQEVHRDLVDGNEVFP
jgi:hypothetical protein